MSDYAGIFILSLFGIVICGLMVMGFITINDTCDDDRLNIAIEDFNSTNFTNSDFARIYLECLKECDNKHTSYNYLDLCFKACKEIKEYQN